MIAKLSFLVVSTALLLGFGGLAVVGVVSGRQTTVANTQDLVQAGAKHIEQILQKQSAGLPRLATKMSREQGLGIDVRALGASVDMIPAGGNVSERLKSRIELLRQKLRERVTSFRNETEGVDAIAFVSESGLVLVSDSEVFQDGQAIPLKSMDEEEIEEEDDADEEDKAEPNEEEPGDDANKDANDKSGEAKKSGEKDGEEEDEGFALTIFDEDAVQSATVVHGGVVRWIGAAPVYLRNMLVGGVIVERKLQSLPGTPGAEVFVLAEGVVTLGKAPAGFEMATVQDVDDPQLLVETEVFGHLGSFGPLPLPLQGVDASTVGVWGKRFSIPGADEESVGFVFSDSTPFFQELADYQTVLVLLLLLVWAAHVFVIFASGWRLVRGIERIADHLGKVSQGMEEQKHLDERAFPRRLTRLVRLLNSGSVGQGTSDPVAPLPKAPSLDDVLLAQEVEPPPDVASLDFEGITDSGSIGVSDSLFDHDPSTKDMTLEGLNEDAPQEEADGFESLGEVADTAADEVEAQEEAPHPENLPELPDALDAVDHLGDPFSDENVAEDAGDDGNELGAFFAQKGAEEADEGLVSAEDVVETTNEVAEGDLSLDEGSLKPVSDDLMASLEAAGATVNKPDGKPEPPETKQPPQEKKPDETSEGDAPDIDHFREVYNDFVAMRKKCGEGGAELSFDKFVTKLEKSEKAVVAKHKCAGVRFQVYEKNGKAALKATPVK